MAIESERGQKGNCSHFRRVNQLRVSPGISAFRKSAAHNRRRPYRLWSNGLGYSHVRILAAEADFR